MKLLRVVFGNRELARLELVWTAATLVRWALAILVALYAYRAGGPGAVGVAALVRMVPAALLAPRLAVIADRRSRRLVLSASLLVRCGLAVAMTLTVWSGGPLAALLAASAVYGAADSLQKPTQAALLAQHARNPTELAAANTLWSMLDNGAFVAGSLLVGALVAGAGLTAAFAACVVPLVLATFVLLGMQADVAPPAFEPVSAREELLAGVRVIRNSSQLRLLVGLFAADMFLQAVLDVLLVVAALGLLELGEEGAGWLSAAWGAGGVVGGATATVLFARGKLAWGITVGLVLAGVPLIAVGLWPGPVSAFPLLALLGVGFGVVEVALLTLTQRLVPADVVARVYGAQETITIVVMALGSVVATALVVLLGVQGALVAAGTFLPLCALAVVFRVRTLDSGATASDADFELLRGVHAFATLPVATIENLAVRARHETVPAGHEVVNQGDTGHTFYVIEKGRVEVLVGDEFRREEHPGEYFGEIGLLHDVHRTATVRAVRPSELLVLDRQEFLTAVGTHPRARHELAIVAEQRLDATTE